MRKSILFLVLACLLLTTTAFAEETIPARYAPILEAWNTTTAEELHLNILDYWKESATRDKGNYTQNNMPLNIRFGGTTSELISDKENWDLAIVSSKDVDLQALVDAQLIFQTGYDPSNPYASHQRLLPEKVQNLLPSDPLMQYYIYVYDYDAQTDDATFLISQDNSKEIYPRNPENFAREIMRVRSADSVRSLEGIRQVDAWTDKKLLVADSVNATNGMRPVDAWTEKELIANAEEWDVAIIMADQGDKLETLDAAGLLFDFSTNPYFPSRTSIRPYERDNGNSYCELTNGIFSSNGRMIGIPCLEHLQEDSDTEGILILNAKSPYLEQAQTYAVHVMKSLDWSWTAENKMWPQGFDTCLYKDEMDW